MASIKIGDYLIQRLKETGIDTIFGVPGDYNMVSYEVDTNLFECVYILKKLCNVAAIGFN